MVGYGVRCRIIRAICKARPTPEIRRFREDCDSSDGIANRLSPTNSITNGRETPSPAVEPFDRIGRVVIMWVTAFSNAFDESVRIDIDRC